MRTKTGNRIYKLIKPYIKTIVIVSILSLLISICELIKPYLIKIVIDDYLSQGIFQKGAITIGMIGASYIGIVLIGNIIDFIASTSNNMMGEHAIYTLRNKLYKYIQYANIPFHDKTPAGKLFVRITNDVEDISTLFKDVITTFIKDVILIIALISIMLYFSIRLSLLSLIVIPFVILSSFIFTRMLNKIYEKSKIIRTYLNTFLAESIYGLKLIKIFNRQKEKQEECEGYTERFVKQRTPAAIIEGLLPAILTILENVAIAIIVCACVNKWYGISVVDVGLIYVFTTYIKQLFEPITRIIENIEVVQEAMVSINKIYDILDEKQHIEDFESGNSLDIIKGKIEFKHVWFSYDNENWILKDVNFTIEPGESAAFVGKTGSGKTTITNLINRFYEIQKGEILIDGINIKDINIRSLRSQIGIILQDPFIFARTIKDNIALNNNMPDEDISMAIELASADSFVKNLKNGIYEEASERGSSYSEGQKQLLAFARIFAHNPSIFILDEATANIDTNTEKLIQKSIDMISKEKTSIFIAHRLSTIVNVDKIIVLDHGEIVEVGNHESLLHTGGYYSKLYNSYYTSLTNTDIATSANI